MSKAGTPYTPEDVALLERATAAGLDNESIAKLLGRTVKSVESKRHDITARKVGRAPGQTKIYSTVSAEDRFARLMGNKRYEDVRLKGDRV